MPILSRPASGPRTATIYITVGALIDVWTIVWYLAFGRGSTGGGMNANSQFWMWGFLLTGLTLMIIGLLLGRIGRAAREAELPPVEAMNAEANMQPAAPPAGVPGTPPATIPVQGDQQPAAPQVIQPATSPIYTGSETVPSVTRR